MTGKQDVSPLDALRLAEPLASQLRFLLEADRLKSVARGSRIADGSRRENSAEHSWHIALFALVLAHHAAERVDALRVVSMLLIHDLVEIDCGDTPLFDAARAATQSVREAIAARRLFGLLPSAQAAEFLALWQEFEAAATADARFAKSVDRLQPTLLNYAVGGGTWTDYDVDEARERADMHYCRRLARAMGGGSVGRRRFGASRLAQAGARNLNQNTADARNGYRSTKS